MVKYKAPGMLFVPQLRKIDATSDNRRMTKSTWQDKSSCRAMQELYKQIPADPGDPEGQSSQLHGKEVPYRAEYFQAAALVLAADSQDATGGAPGANQCQKARKFRLKDVTEVVEQ